MAIHLKSNMRGDFIAPDKVVSKVKPKDIIDITVSYRLKRDRVLWKICDEETKQALKIKYKL